MICQRWLIRCLPYYQCSHGTLCVLLLSLGFCNSQGCCRLLENLLLAARYGPLMETIMKDVVESEKLYREYTG
ncbi:uncharacterized protein BDZ83DRAFT_630042 [Colletotrichum acutatum]|uniref:Uncharacterized protein n=1 Tax=Glomerella acutata TaxID=27357 RepID=A0AAD8UI86_GLOAC|nr:uncharacterized protein BDZ83DRAFT_630042 [Colletotrichum acutatum]KAK1721409.1 hypothetical protein BDZ83DRAFT_630042 [Colletotrichum acutatum]